MTEETKEEKLSLKPTGLVFIYLVMVSRSVLPIGNDNRIHLLQIRDQILDRADLQAEPLAEFQACVPPHHAGVAAQLGHAFDQIAFFDEFSDDARRGFARQATEIDCGLGVSSPLTDAADSCPQRQDVSWAAEVLGSDVWVGQLPAGQGSIVGGDPRRDGGVVRVDRDCVCGAVRVGVVDHHLWQGQTVGEIGEDRSANVATVDVRHCRLLDGESARSDRSPCGLPDEYYYINVQSLPRVPHHESHLGFRNRIRRYNKIALILTVLRIEDNYEFAVFCNSQRHKISNPSEAKAKDTGQGADTERIANSLNAATASSIGSNCKPLSITAGILGRCSRYVFRPVGDSRAGAGILRKNFAFSFPQIPPSINSGRGNRDDQSIYITAIVELAQ